MCAQVPCVYLLSAASTVIRNTILVGCSGRELCLRLQTGRQAWRLRGTRRSLSLTSNLPLLSSCWPRLGDTRPGPRLNSSSPLESPTEGSHMSTSHNVLVIVIVINHRPSHRCWSTSLSSSSSSSSIPCSSGTSIFLFYVIGFFFIYKIIFLFLFKLCSRSVWCFCIFVLLCQVCEADSVPSFPRSVLCICLAQLLLFQGQMPQLLVGVGGGGWVTTAF